MKKIKAPAIKTPKGVVSVKPPANHATVANKALRAVGTNKGERGFKTTGGNFVSRQTAKKIANESGQAIVKGVRGLHSSDVFKKPKKG